MPPPRHCRAPSPWQGVHCIRPHGHYDDHAATNVLGTYVWTRDTAERYTPAQCWDDDPGCNCANSSPQPVTADEGAC